MSGFVVDTGYLVERGFISGEGKPPTHWLDLYEALGDSDQLVMFDYDEFTYEGFYGRILQAVKGCCNGELPFTRIDSELSEEGDEIVVSYRQPDKQDISLRFELDGGIFDADGEFLEWMQSALIEHTSYRLLDVSVSDDTMITYFVLPAQSLRANVKLDSLRQRSWLTGEQPWVDWPVLLKELQANAPDCVIPLQRRGFMELDEFYPKLLEQVRRLCSDSIHLSQIKADYTESDDVYSFSCDVDGNAIEVLEVANYDGWAESHLPFACWLQSNVLRPAGFRYQDYNLGIDEGYLLMLPDEAMSY